MWPARKTRRLLTLDPLFSTLTQLLETISHVLVLLHVLVLSLSQPLFPAAGEEPQNAQVVAADALNVDRLALW